MERLLPQLLASQYNVYHFCDNGASLISNDLCLTPMIGLIKGLKGWAIPISTSAALGLFPCKSNRLAQYVNGSWVVKVNSVVCDPGAFFELNAAIARTSSSFIFGSDEATVESLRGYMSRKSRFDVTQIMESFWFDEHSIMAEGHELDWYVVAPIADTNLQPDGAIKPEATLFQTNPSLWHPFIFEFPSTEEWRCGVAIEDNLLYCFCQEQPSTGKPQLASP